MLRKYISIFTLLLLFNACSDEEANEVVTEKDALSVNANIAVSVVTGGQTRADEPEPEPFTKPFDLYIKQTAPTGGSLTHDYTLHDATYKDSKYTVTESNNPWYWDDNGGVNAKLNLIGIYPKGINVTVASSVLTFSWEVTANQNTDDVKHDDLDLCISELKENYTLDVQKTGDAAAKNLEFSHALSQLTFVLIKNNGFEDEEAFEPTIETIELQTKGDVNIATNGNITVTPAIDALTKIRMTPQLMDSPTSTAKQRKFIAIAIPGQKFEKGKEFATISLTINEEINKYSIKLPDDKDINFLPGTNHQFKIIVNKTQSEFLTATVMPWDNGDGIEQVVNINVEGNSGGLNTDVVTGAQLHVMIKKGEAGKEEEVNPSLRRSTIYETDKWKDFNPTLYWDDIPKTDKTFAFGLLFNNTKAADATDPADINKDPENIYMGQTTKLDKAYKYLNFDNLTHPFSRIAIKIQTERGKSYSVDLTNLKKIRFNTVVNRFQKIDTGSQEITYYTNIDETYLSDIGLTIADSDIDKLKDATYDFYEVPYIYIKPGVTVPAKGEILRLFYDNGNGVLNEYPLVWEENRAITFGANNKHEIVITLNKTEIANVGVTIKDWSTGQTITGGSTIKD